MKKFLALLLVLCLSLAMVACESSTPQADPKEEEFKAAQDAYNCLVDVHETCVSVMDSVYGAWYFSIYEYDDYYGITGFEEFCSKTSIPSDEFAKIIREWLGSDSYSKSTLYSFLKDFSDSVSLVTLFYEKNETFSETQALLDEARASLKSVTAQYADYTGYETLKKYYSELSSYFEFCQNPTGSFEQLKTTIETYERNLRTYKSDLSFVFE